MFTWHVFLLSFSATNPNFLFSLAIYQRDIPALDMKYQIFLYPFNNQTMELTSSYKINSPLSCTVDQFCINLSNYTCTCAIIFLHSIYIINTIPLGRALGTVRRLGLLVQGVRIFISSNHRLLNAEKIPDQR